MPRILIVDDDVIISTRLEELLGFIGYDVVGVACSGKEGVEKAKKFRSERLPKNGRVCTMCGDYCTMK